MHTMYNKNPRGVLFMKQPSTKIYIDARHEVRSWESFKKAEYYISGLETDEVRNKIYGAIGGYVQELIIDNNDANKLIVSYNPNFITLTYIDYLFRLKGIDFKRDGC